MRAGWFLFATAAGQAAPTETRHQEQTDKSFLTIGRVLNFAKESVVLTFDVTKYAYTRAQNKVLSLIPHENQNIFVEGQNAFSNMRQSIGIPDMQTLQDAAAALYAHVSEVVVDKAGALNIQVEAWGASLQSGLNVLFEDFQNQYPQAPLLPSGLVDRLFIMCFLFYCLFLVCSYMKKIVCLPFKILGFCCGRKQKPTRGESRYTAKKKKQ